MKNKKCFDADVTVGIVGHCPIETLQELKRTLEAISDFDLVFLKTSSGKLWIKEGEVGNDLLRGAEAK